MISPHQPGNMPDLLNENNRRETGKERKEVVLIPRVELGTSPLPRVRRAAGIEPASSAWKAEVIAIIRCPHPETRLPSSFCNTKETALFSIELISLPNQLRLRKASPESGGGGRIRTFEVDDGRFTVCSLWPLGNPTQIGADYRNRTGDLLITSQLLYLLS